MEAFSGNSQPLKRHPLAITSEGIADSRRQEGPPAFATDGEPLAANFLCRPLGRPKALIEGCRLKPASHPVLQATEVEPS